MGGALNKRQIPSGEWDDLLAALGGDTQFEANSGKMREVLEEWYPDLAGNDWDVDGTGELTVIWSEEADACMERG